MDAVIVLEGQRVGPEFKEWERNPLVNYETVTAGYFDAIGIDVIRGRGFTNADREDAPRVAILSEGLARRLWPGENPIGKRMLPPATTFDETGAPRWTTVVGIVRDARYRGLRDPRFDLYVPYRQNVGVRIKHLMVRTTGDPLAFADPIRAAARRLDSAAIVEGVTTMGDLVRRATASWRFSASTLGLLSFIALGLAALGIYATVSQSVAERTHEIGVRVAVGAAPRQVAHLAVREGLGLAAVGIAAGVLIASGVARILTGLLFEVEPIHPLTYGATAALFVVVTFAATALPASAAARVDPIVALKRP
jgi:putative ABC transport system permease protein